ncbi:MAG: glycoside hydrolase family 3 protein, partial [Acidimicrobiia bacterium]|nr:glycoside hydrolase family 3 protein [Acidimicrobiia bacterium]
MVDIGDLLARMTMAEKAGQLTQVEKNSITPDEVAEFAVGSVLSGCGGNPDPNNAANWRAMVESFLDGARRSRLGVPLLYGTDSVHGHANVYGATIFPHNVGLGAVGDADLVERVCRATALETAATGARWAFAPTVAVALDPRWGRTYEAFGSDTDLVGGLGAAAVRGLQGSDPTAGDRVAACLKHYVGDGGTTWGSLDKLDWIDWWDGWGPRWKIDQGDTRVDEATLRRVHLRPYRDGLAAGSLTVMASYNSWNGVKLHANHYLLTELLKGELGFDGFVISDWLAIDQLSADPYRCVIQSINAGVDMVMVPFDFRRFIDNVIRAVESGDIPMARLDDAVRRILGVKAALGLFDPTPPDLPPVEVVGCAEHRALAREAVAASVVRLKDPDRVLPLDSRAAGKVLVAGAGADDIGLQCGGWTIQWQGGTGPITIGSTVLDGLRSAGLEIAYRPDGDFPDDSRA